MTFKIEPSGEAFEKMDVEAFLKIALPAIYWWCYFCIHIYVYFLALYSHILDKSRELFYNKKQTDSADCCGN